MAGANIYGELVELETSRNHNRISGYTVAEVWLTVLWSGTSPGSRSLVLPNEESVVVNTRIFIRSSQEAVCNFTDETIGAGQVYSIELGYNVSVTIQLNNFNGSSVIYNVFTYSTPDEYQPEVVSVSLAEYLAFAQEVGVVCAGFGAVFALAAIKVRSAT